MYIFAGRCWKEKVRKAALLLAFRTLLECKNKNGGEGGIRTLETGLSPFTHLAGVLLRPARTPLRFLGWALLHPLTKKGQGINQLKQVVSSGILFLCQGNYSPIAQTSFFVGQYFVSII